MVCDISVGVPLTASGSLVPDLAATEAEREQALAALTTFKRFNPPTFERVVGDSWAVDMWITSMETLFEDIYTLEQDEVYLATHCFEKSARV